MPRREKETWREIAVANAQSAQRYILACKIALLEHDDAVAADTKASRPRHFEEAVTESTLGLSRTEVQQTQNFVCFVCKETCSQGDARILLANPFSRSSYSVSCGACLETIRAQ